MRTGIWLTLGCILLALGAVVGVRPLFTHGATLTGSRLLDVAFALVFIVRGGMNVKRGLKGLSA